MGRGPKASRGTGGSLHGIPHGLPDPPGTWARRGPRVRAGGWREAEVEMEAEGMDVALSAALLCLTRAAVALEIPWPRGAQCLSPVPS